LIESADEYDEYGIVLKVLDLLYFLGHINHNFKVFCSTVDSMMTGAISVITPNA
jgi:hypothetical protein